MEKDIFMRTELLIGSEAMKRIATKKVILFGVGGVGSWCAESLVRSGIKHLTIVDSDRVVASNINRQLLATTNTVGQVKVEVLKSRLLAINPEADITAMQTIYSAEVSDTFKLETYDYIIDAIDSLEHKVHLIRTATKTPATFFSSMGAALKMDPLRIRVAEFWKVKGCPLGAALRRKLKKGEMPAKKFKCVYSDELLDNKGELPTATASVGGENAPGDPALANHTWDTKKAQINGTVMHVTAMFGLHLASLVIQDIIKE